MKFTTFILIIAIIESKCKSTVIKRSTECGLYQFACNSTQCIDEELVCNGKCDCDDKSDEREEICKNVKCPKYAYRCSYGGCINGGFKCDGNIDCLDGSDELSKFCPGQGVSKCDPDQFECTSGECIDEYRICDGLKHCQDASDETWALCKDSFCPHTAFRCAYGACVRRGAKCDGYKDCFDKSDEDPQICGSRSTLPADTVTKQPGTRQTSTTSTTTPPPNIPRPAGSCVVPTLKNSKVVNSIFGDEYKPGEFVDDLEVIKVSCDPKFSMLLVKESDNDIICKNGTWSIAFPKCQKLCPTIFVLGRTIKTDCVRNGASVPCEGSLPPGTLANIKCKNGYRLPDRTDLQPTLSCLDSGDWDYAPFRCSPVCGAPTPKAKPYVVNGKDTDIAEVPWAVAIYRTDVLICGGTILTEKLVVSAAHCFFKEEETGASPTDTVSLYPKDSFKIVVGKYFRDIAAKESLPIQEFKVSDIVTVPGYDGYTGYFAADIAIVVLNNFIEFKPHIAPICLERNLEFSEEKIVREGSEGLVAGWGYTESDGKPSDVLKTAVLPVVNFQQCRKEAPADYKSFITPDKFCAGYKDTNSYGVCRGDSGGGFVVSRVVGDENVYFLKGIVSNGRATQGACDLMFYTLFVNVQEYISYIKNSERDNPVI